MWLSDSLHFMIGANEIEGYTGRRRRDGLLLVSLTKRWLLGSQPASLRTVMGWEVVDGINSPFGAGAGC